MEQIEHYFLVQVPQTAPDVNNTSPEDIEELRWWSLTDLQATQDTVYPEGFAEMVNNILNDGAA